ncbi:energy-coupling factor transporter transmembrane component T family protein [Enemella sp. A6]|uniref:energy-coupling factor transporter transmembrane component T family protein n=1 Tax=Enemella sp. A6 TaxID=3440152 RepID=UPI003EB89241
MNRHNQLFGRFIPRRSPLHRLPAGATMVLVIALAFSPVVIGRWWVSCAILGFTWLLLLLARIPLRVAWPLPLVIVALVAVLVAYHLWFNTWQQAVFIAANLLVAVYAARLLIATQPTPALVDTLTAVARPARVFGLDPEKFALAVAVMLRSVPYLLGMFGDVRDAARARGLERNPLALISPLVVRAVGYAVATGEALAARGLGERSERPGAGSSRP